MVSYTFFFSMLSNSNSLWFSRCSLKRPTDIRYSIIPVILFVISFLFWCSDCEFHSIHFCCTSIVHWQTTTSLYFNQETSCGRAFDLFSRDKMSCGPIPRQRYFHHKYHWTVEHHVYICISLFLAYEKAREVIPGHQVLASWSSKPT